MQPKHLKRGQRLDNLQKSTSTSALGSVSQIEASPPPPRRMRLSSNSDQTRPTDHEQGQMQVGGGREPITLQLGPTQKAFQNALLAQTLIPSRSTDDLKEFLEALIPYVKKSLQDLLVTHHGLKFWIQVQIQFFNTVELKFHEGGLQTKAQLVNNSFEIDDILKFLSDDICLRLANYLRNGSPNTVDSIESAILHTAKYAPLSAGCYKELPKYLKSKSCIVNVQNIDNRCFGFSILAALHPPGALLHTVIEQVHMPNISRKMGSIRSLIQLRQLIFQQ